MKDTGQILRAADPFVHEGTWTAAERQSVLRAVRHANQEKPETSRRSFMYGFAAAAATVVAVIVGLEWPRVIAVAAVRLEVRLAEEGPGLELEPATVRASGERIYLHRQAVIVNGDIAAAETVQEADATFGVVVRLTREGAAKLLQTTRQNVGRRLAIVLDGDVVVVLTVRSPISSSAVISGGYTKAEADRIATGIVGR
jgi:SecD-like export protein